MPTLLDNYTNMSGGMNDSFEPSTIQRDQVRKGINVVCRDGILKTRLSR